MSHFKEAGINAPYIKISDYLSEIGAQLNYEVEVTRNCWHEVWICHPKAVAFIVIRYGDHGASVYAPICKQNSIPATIEAIKNY